MTIVPMTNPANSDLDDIALVPDLADSLTQLLESARREIDENQEAAKASIARATSLLRVELERTTTAVTHDAAPGRLAGWQVNRLRTFIDNHLDGTIHITDLAKVARRSTAYFCRAFKRTFGETPHAYIVRRRLHRGRHLMLTTDLALSEIALSCGFTDQAHLCRLFRQTHNQSPAAWRRERCDGTSPAVAVQAVCGRPCRLRFAAGERRRTAR
ncbi:AraC family transcriptional regulator [Phenylobacterium sp.]|uniref:helix-turn-helix transcriptional regulator n=1 Tax=Phenylobacterium sp. TaxID=1871053 RepID=UPI002E2F5107|nr:AraC family transcriptional regulator [Phenylobacterium sp.]HEX4712031.1 AraC family transcriptional regulator [Phenylobacterium sp.]